MTSSKRRCKQCGEYVSEWVSLPAGVFCSIEHAQEWSQAKAQKDREKAYKARTREKKRAMRDSDRSYWMKKAQAAFNSYIRERDRNLPCVSCGRHHAGQYHAGHYRTTAAAPELRFDERNCHKQCAPCNNHKSGNITKYRIKLIRRIGEAQVIEIEGPHEPKRYSVEDLKSIERKYKEKLSELKYDR